MTKNELDGASACTKVPPLSTASTEAGSTSDFARAEAQRVAECAGFTFALPKSTFSMVSTYRPSAPEFARMGTLALYMRACVDLALARDPHSNAIYARCLDPMAVLCRTLAQAEADGDKPLAAQKARSLDRLIADVLASSRRDRNRFRRLSFAVALHRDIGRTFLDIGAELRVASDKLALLARASDHFDRAMVFLDAMHNANSQAMAAE